MKRGEIWTVAGGKDYVGKPRLAVIVQDDRFDTTDSVTICAFTTDPTDAPLLRLLVAPNERNGRHAASGLTVGKITTIPRTKLGTRIGALDADDMVRCSVAFHAEPRGRGAHRRDLALERCL